MKLIKEFGSRNMKHIQYDHEDAIRIKNRFIRLNQDLIDQLCQWLKENNAVIDAIDCYDSQSGWSGTDFMIGKANLALNGYCLRDENIELFINGGQDPQWYHFYEPEYEEAKKWKEENN